MVARLLLQYLGEVINPHEGDKRGLKYDELNQNYLFTLTKDYLVDAWNRGNKTRFMNHSNTPNVLQKLHMVNGDFRIGFFAKENIKAQSEVRHSYYDTGLLACHSNLLVTLLFLFVSAFL